MTKANDSAATFNVWGDGRGVPVTVYVLLAKGEVVRWTSDLDDVEGWLLDPLNSAVVLAPDNRVTRVVLDQNGELIGELVMSP